MDVAINGLWLHFKEDLLNWFWDRNAMPYYHFTEVFLSPSDALNDLDNFGPTSQPQHQFQYISWGLAIKISEYTPQQFTSEPEEREAFSSIKQELAVSNKTKRKSVIVWTSGRRGATGRGEWLRGRRMVAEYLIKVISELFSLLLLCLPSHVSNWCENKD